MDAHAHVRPCFAVGGFLEGAAANFRASARQLGRPRGTGCLLVADPPGEGGFRRLLALADDLAGERADGERLPVGWTFSKTKELDSLLAWRDPDSVLLFLAGRQLVSREGLEVLALAAGDDARGGEPLDDLVRGIVRGGGVAIVPWGFGKWWFARGRVLARLLTDPPGPGFFVGDHAGRPRGGLEPAPLRRARLAGIANLPGTDPLPTPSGERAAGAYGFLVEGDLPADRPAAVLRQRLRSLRGGQPTIYGRRGGTWDFLVGQVAVRRARARCGGAAGVGGGR